MKKRSKRYKKSKELIQKDKFYKIEEAVEIIKKLEKAKFNETVELHIKLGVDPKRSEEMVRGTVVLPHGIGKKIKVAVFAKGESEKHAQQAGADIVGSEDLIEKIQKGWLEFDVAIATPDMMGQVSKLGKILGPRGLMPNPKTGTVTQDVGKAIKEFKEGKVEFKVDKTSNIHTIVGKKDFEQDKLIENIKTMFEAIVKARPQAFKGQYIKDIFIKTTMGPSIKLDFSHIASLIK